MPLIKENPDVTTPVRYVGPEESYRDHLYGTGAEWEFNESIEIPVPLAMKLLRHPEFEDARPVEEQDVPIKALLGKPRREFAPTDEADVAAPLVDLNSLTKDQLVEHGMRYYGLRLQPTMKKADLVNQLRLQSGRAPVGQVLEK